MPQILSEALRYLNLPPFGEVNGLNLFLLEFQSSLPLVADGWFHYLILGHAPLLSSVKTGSVKVHFREVELARISFNT